MTIILETGAGTPNANAYVTTAFVLEYLTSHERQTQNGWDSIGATIQAAAVIKATAYIDGRFGPRFKGRRLELHIEGRGATGTLTLGSVPLEGEIVTVGQKTYKFTATITVENDVLIGATVLESVTNLQAALVGTPDGVIAHERTLENFEVSSAVQDDETLLVGSRAFGENGNEIVFTTDITGASVTGAGTLVDGLDDGTQPLEFPRRELLGSDFKRIRGIPLKLKQATAEYAVRSLSAELAPDLETDDTGGIVTGKTEKIGPITEGVTFDAGRNFTFQPYAAADALLAEYLMSTAGVSR